MNSKSGIKPIGKPPAGYKSRTNLAKNEKESLSRASSLASVTEGVACDTKVNFSIGEKVWVNGTKPGTVQFLGETQFAAGIWAGVKLDETDGKNDGSVNGIKYFECEPMKGIFIRPHRLTKEAGSPPSLAGDSSPLQKNSAPSSTRQGLPSRVAQSSPGKPTCSRLRPGERVIVNSATGTKCGTLRFIGTADFAAGEWAGIELDEPIGKNDGSVGGKRYFECKMKHGLFAPTHKVSCVGGSVTPRSGSAAGSLHSRSYSRESLNSSVSSVASSRASRVKLGITSLSSSQKAKKSTSSIVSPTQNALQELLKEKEEHIDQLLKERDLERIEYAKLASRAAEAEDKLEKLEAAYKSYVEESEAELSRLKSMCEVEEMQSKNTKALLEEEKRKMEDLQFRLEEEMILKGELETQRATDQKHLNALESSETKIKELLSEINALKELVDEGERKQQAEKTEVNDLKSGIKERDEFIDRLKEALEEEKKKVAEGQKVEEMLNSNAALEDAEKKIKEMSIKIEALELECTTLKEGHEKLAILKKSLDETTREFKAFKQSAKEREEQLTNELAEKDGLYQTLDSTLVAMQKREEKIKEEIEQKSVMFNREVEKLTNQLNEKDQLCVQLKAEVSTLSTSLGEKDVVLEKTLGDLKDAKDEINCLSKDKSESVVMLQSKVSELKTENENAKTEFEKNMQLLKEENEKLMNSLKAKDSDVASKGGELENLKIAISKKDETISCLKQELDDGKKKLETLNKELSTIHEELDKIKSESHSMINDREQSLHALQSEVAKCTSLIEQKAKENTAMQEHIKELQEALKTKEGNMLELVEKVETSKKQLQQLKNDNENNVAILESKVAEFRVEQERHLQEKEKKLQEEIDRLENLIGEKDGIMKKQESQLADVTAVLQQKDVQVKTLEDQLKMKESEFCSKLAQEDSSKAELVAQINKLKIACESLSKEKDQIISEVRAAEEARKELEKTKDSLISDKVEKESLIKDKEAKLEFLQHEVKRMQKEFMLHKQELEQKLDVSQMELEAMKEFKAELELQHGVLEELQQQLQSSENECARLQCELDNVSSISSEKKHLEGRLNDFQEQLQKKTQRGTELEEENKGLRHKLQDLEGLLKQKNGELEVTKLAAQGKQSEQADALKHQVKKLEEENKTLSEDLSKLKSQLTVNNNANNKTEDDQDEKETLLSQINFLNSIIVDMQKQNEELKKKQDAFIQDAASDMIEQDVNLNGVKKIPPRLFCDICDMFDLHDTEDCPKQSSFIEDESAHSHHHGNRHEERPYCNSCEIFGHWTLDCDDQQTF